MLRFSDKPKKQGGLYSLNLGQNVDHRFLLNGTFFLLERAIFTKRHYAK